MEVNNEERGLDSNRKMTAVFGPLLFTKGRGIFYNAVIKCYPA